MFRASGDPPPEPVRLQVCLPASRHRHGDRIASMGLPDTPACPPGQAPAADPDFDKVYAQLRSLARQMLTNQRPGHTLQATALVNEAYLHLLQGAESALADPSRFHRVAAVAMRNILIDYARGRGRQKRDGRRQGIPLDAVELASQGDTDEILTVDEAITHLEGTNPELAELVQMRFFAGLTIEDVARAQGRSERSVYRDWTYAKALLLRELRE